MGKRFRRVCKNAGIKDLRIHDLRHFATTMLFIGGGPDAIIRKMTGHWDQSVWYTGVTGKEPNDEDEDDPDVKASGVMIQESVLDEFVVMRLAEMLQERKAREAVSRAVSKWSGNGRLPRA